MESKNLFYSLLGLFALTFIGLALFTDGTGGSGDSIQHYFFARYGWKYPELLFDHWGKPVYSILCSPFAQFGMKGVKLFNVIITIAAVWYSYRVAEKLKIRFASLMPLFYLGASHTVNVTLSGLTEPLFALVLIISVFYFLEKKWLLAIFICSFLPLVRSEGLIVVVVVSCYLLINRKFLLIPFILSGQLIINLLGLPYYDSLLWVFTRIPYAKLSTIYETGSWQHFIAHLPFDIGPVLYGLLLLGIAVWLFNFVRQQIAGKWSIWLEGENVLIYGVFLAFLTAHSLFYALAIFGEMGLTRVFVGVMPLMAIIALQGLNVLINLQFIRPFSVATVVIFSMAILFYCYGNTPFSVRYSDIDLSPDQKFMKKELNNYLGLHAPIERVYCSDVGLLYLIDVDPFRHGKYGSSLASISPEFAIRKNELIIWDDWFSVVEENCRQMELDSNPHLKKEASFSTPGERGHIKQVLLYTAN